MRFPQKATEDTRPGRDLSPSLLFLKAAAVLLPRFLTWSLPLPVLQARTTVAMPTFPPTQARSLLSSNSCLLVSKPSAPFSTALPAHRDPVDPRVGLSTFLPAPAHSCTPPGPRVSRAPVTPTSAPLPCIPDVRSVRSISPLPRFPRRPLPYGPARGQPSPPTHLPRTSPPLTSASAVSLPGYLRAHPPSGSPRGAPTSGSGTFFMMPVFLLLKVV